MTSRNASPGSVPFDRVAGIYDATRGLPPETSARFGELIAHEARIGSSGRLLEIGVGTGRVARAVAPHVGSVVGVDLSRPMLEQLRRQRGALPVHVARADATRLPLPDASVDAVLVVRVFHLIPAWRRALDEVARVLRPGAALVHAESGVPVLDAVSRRASRGSGFRVARAGAGERDRSLDVAGWPLDAEPASFSFQRSLVPAAMLRLIGERAFAWTFALSNAELETALGAARQAMREHFASLDDPVELKGVCRVERRRPPDA